MLKLVQNGLSAIDANRDNLHAWASMEKIAKITALGRDERADHDNVRLRVNRRLQQRVMLADFAD